MVGPVPGTRCKMRGRLVILVAVCIYWRSSVPSVGCGEFRTEDGVDGLSASSDQPSAHLVRLIPRPTRRQGVNI